MLLIRFVVAMFSAGLMVLGAGIIYAENYPNKPIRMVTSEPGGSGDVLARLIAQGLTSLLGQSIIVENRPEIVMGKIVATATPDGYTLLLNGAIMWIAPLLQKMPYDPVKDFSPISLAIRSPNILVVHPALAVNSVKELIALAKAKPGALNYASGPTGASNHLAPELFKAMAGVDIVRIPYKGGGPALSAVIGGQVQLMFATAGGLAPHVKAGRLRALAVSSAQPSALFPGLPTIAAAGLPGYEAGSIMGMWAPAKTPGAIVQRLHQDIVTVLGTPEVKERILITGAEAVTSTPEQFAALIKVEMIRMDKLIKDAGIRAE